MTVSERVTDGQTLL